MVTRHQPSINRALDLIINYTVLCAMPYMDIKCIIYTLYGGMECNAFMVIIVARTRSTSSQSHCCKTVDT